MLSSREKLQLLKDNTFLSLQNQEAQEFQVFLDDSLAEIGKQRPQYTFRMPLELWNLIIHYFCQLHTTRSKKYLVELSMVNVGLCLHIREHFLTSFVTKREKPKWYKHFAEALEWRLSLYLQKKRFNISFPRYQQIYLAKEFQHLDWFLHFMVENKKSGFKTIRSFGNSREILDPIVKASTSTLTVVELYVLPYISIFDTLELLTSCRLTKLVLNDLTRNDSDQGFLSFPHLSHLEIRMSCLFEVLKIIRPPQLKTLVLDFDLDPQVPELFKDFFANVQSLEHLVVNAMVQGNFSILEHCPPGLKSLELAFVHPPRDEKYLVPFPRSLESLSLGNLNQSSEDVMTLLKHAHHLKSLVLFGKNTSSVPLFSIFPLVCQDLQELHIKALDLDQIPTFFAEQCPIRRLDVEYSKNCDTLLSSLLKSRKLEHIRWITNESDPTHLQFLLQQHSGIKRIITDFPILNQKVKTIPKDIEEWDNHWYSESEAEMTDSDSETSSLYFFIPPNDDDYQDFA
ncbi:hypothetical protein EDD86DRAFT_244359 [Gorgonomyces haynaldii]|nr:hypothetical protein EDD86DRAFT_244359 [Gorgonomyces haynaldii]